MALATRSAIRCLQRQCPCSTQPFTAELPLLPLEIFADPVGHVVDQFALFPKEWTLPGGGFFLLIVNSIAPTEVRQTEIGERSRHGMSIKYGRACVRPRYSMRAVVSVGYCQAGGMASSTQRKTT